MSSPAQMTKAKRKRQIPKPGAQRAPGVSYISWLQHVSAFTRYIHEDLDSESLLAYQGWTNAGHLPSTASILDESPDFPQLALHDLRFVSAVQVPASTDAPRHLFALEIEDLLEFSSDDILAAWPLRAQCCGSIEVAAELYALYRVLTGIDELYAGPTAYLDHPHVVGYETFVAPDDDVRQQAVQIEGTLPASVPDIAPPELEPVSSAGFSLAEVPDLSIDELKAAWSNRPESFASLEAAAETLAILRSITSADGERPTYLRMMQHPLVQDLEDFLPLEVQAAPPSPAVELELLRTDRRSVRVQASVIRPGQGNFRAAMLERYGGECCITGCRIDALLEAAHIVPYRGDQSDDATNGLLLRVDIHRLFDAHLVSINPVAYTVEVSPALEDDGYQAYHGKRLFAFSPKPRKLFLEAHFQAFKKAPPR